MKAASPVQILDDNSNIFYYVGCFPSPFFCQPIILFVRVIENTPPFIHGTYFFRLQCIKIVYSFAQDDLERPDWSRYLKCCLNFKINQLKQTIVDKSVHFVNFWLYEILNVRWKYLGKFLRIIFEPIRKDFTEAGLTQKEESHLIILRTFINHLSLKYIFQFSP